MTDRLKTRTAGDFLFGQTLMNNKIFCTEYGRLHLATQDGQSDPNASDHKSNPPNPDLNATSSKKPFLFQKLKSRRPETQPLDIEFEKYEH